MGKGWGTRRGVIAGLSALGAAGVTGALSQARQAVAQPDADVAGATNNVLVIGYDYINVDGFEPVLLADAALSIAREFYSLKKNRREVNGRALTINVSVLHNSKSPRQEPNNSATFETFEKFLERPLKGSNVILYFVGHGIIGRGITGRGIELVDDTGKSTRVWDMLDRIGAKEPAARVAIVDCCRKSADLSAERISADLVSAAGQEVAFIFSTPPNEVAKVSNDAGFYGTEFTRAFAQRLYMQIELSSLFKRVRQDLREPKDGQTSVTADPILHTSLSRSVWLAGEPPAFGFGNSVKLFFPG